MLGGTFDVLSRPAQGTQIAVTVPIGLQNSRAIAPLTCRSCRSSLATTSHPVRQRASATVRGRNQHRAENQRGAGAYHAKNDVLRNDVEKNRDRNEIADRGKHVFQQLWPEFLVKDQSPQKRAGSFARILSAVPNPQQYRRGGLKDKAEAARPVKARKHISKEVTGEEVGVPGFDDPIERIRRQSQQDGQHDDW